MVSIGVVIDTLLVALPTVGSSIVGIAYGIKLVTCFASNVGIGGVVVLAASIGEDTVLISTVPVVTSVLPSASTVSAAPTRSAA